MTQVRVEIEGSADEVVRVLWDLGNAGRHANRWRCGPVTGDAVRQRC